MTLYASSPFIFFDPFAKSSSSPLPADPEEICNDGQDNNGDGLVDENCGSESITKILEDSVASHQNASIKRGKSPKCLYRYSSSGIRDMQ